VGSELHATAVCHSQVNGAVWLRHAADGGSASARLMLATDLLSADPSAAQAAQARSLLERAATSDSFYVRKHVVALLAASPLDSVRDPGTAQPSVRLTWPTGISARRARSSRLRSARPGALRGIPA
jgi:TPR repeat protein